MSVLEFIAAMSAALAWPAAAVVVAALFRTQLRQLLAAPATRVKAGPIEVEWDRTLAEAEVGLEGTGVTSSTRPTQGGPLSTELIAVAERSPTAAVMEAHARIERQLRDLLLRADVPEERARVGAVRLARLAAERRLVSDETVRAIEGLSVLRNLAAHGQAGGVGVHQAVDYLALADAVLYALTKGTDKA